MYAGAQIHHDPSQHLQYVTTTTTTTTTTTNITTIIRKYFKDPEKH
jgi:hypothetical protein